VNPSDAPTAVSKNPNHPAKGSSIRTDPIRNKKDIEKILALLSGNPRDSALFILGIHTNLRASDIVALTVGQVAHLEPGQELVTRDKKTSRYMVRSLAEPVVRALRRWLSVHPRGTDKNAPLFLSQRSGAALTAPALSRKVKAWCAQAGVTGGNYSSHSLRKTFAYHALNTFNQPVHLVSAALGHKQLATTLTYLGVQDRQIRQLFMNTITDTK
jgi:integrase